MKQKQNSKSKSTGSKTRHNSNQDGFFKESKAISSKSNGATHHNPGSRVDHNSGSRVNHNSNENAWIRSRHSSVSDMWSDADEHFPALGASAASGPSVNVWEERKSKQEAIKALEPQSQFDEEAMLQHALAMSLLEAEEEEKRKKIEEEYYKEQLEAFQYSPKDLNNFDLPDECIVKKDSKLEADFSSKGQHQLENCSRNSISSCSQKEKSYNSAGARPKISKAIEAFGGWGLKDDKKRNNSEKISNFVDDVISENSVAKSNNYNKTFNDQKNKPKNIKDNCTSSQENSWYSTDTKNCRKSSTEKPDDNKEEILYDERGTFLDDDGIWGSSNSEANNASSISPNEALDTWLNSEDVDDWNNEILNEKKVPTLNDKKTNNFVTTSFDDKPKIEDDVKRSSTSVEFSLPTIANGCESPVVENSQTLFQKTSESSVEFSLPAVANDCEPKIIKNSQTLFQKTSEPSKNIWSNKTNYEEQGLPENKSAYDSSNLNTNNFTPFHEPTQVPTLTNSSSLWSDTSSSNSSYFSSFSDNLSNKLESVKLCSDVENEVFNVDSPSNDSDVPPIPPPQPVSTIANVNECSASAIATANIDCKVEPSPIPQPQIVPEMPMPQFPALVNPILNPLFPALNPMMGPAMDPLLMRQMLILSNPYLANQLLLFEQYYRSVGLTVDLFSMTSPVPNIPGMMNPPLLQNAFANNMNGNVQQLQSEIQQLQSQIDATAASMNKNTAENLEPESCERSHNPSGFDAVLDFNNSSASRENDNDDPWFKSYLSNDDASIIPPPKPPSVEVNCNNLRSVPQKSESNHNASTSVHNFVHAVDNSAVIHSSNTTKESSLTAFEACATKNDVTGWSDPEDDYAQNLKSQTWDDGWGDDVPPPKPLRNLSLHEDKKKAVFRQPAKQPQISRYQRNFKYS